ncbi:hypothetical protein L1987_49293 [Smallanthus sonchifolius]|uniref:Uncharacterized protein n=1 Tax=Smallanthus sonchifolius TaxID=185202 RepID=A0ACB9FVY3_9ASTR|nr:hypothetical protein L1987_49293 [Smallanthus sonchifolius]
MDPVVYGALEEICSQGVNGLTLRALWSKIHSHISSNGLDLCTDVKKALWSNLLNIPSLRFEYKGVSYDAGNPTIQLFEDSEAMDLKIVAAEHLINSFVGIYDIKASDAAVSQTQRRVLERLAIARTDGITQNELAKEFGIKNNNMYYILRNLETRGLIVRQSTIVRTKEAGNEEYKYGSIVNTNMLHLYRYAKHLGHLQRLEITKEDKAFTVNDNADREVASGDGVEERINDYVPAFRAICDRLEKADGKVLVVSDIKKELGYRKTHGHRAWRNILHKLKDAGLVEEFFATVNNKEVSCLRLLKNFSPETFMPKSHGGGDDDLDTEQQVKLAKRGQITDQLFELPIEQQIYDMIDAEGSKGLTLNEVYKRLGINNKRYYPRILDMVSRFQMHLDSEGLNRGVVYRVWTPGNYNAGVPNTPPGKSKYTKVEKSPTHAQAGQLMLTHVDAEASEEQSINPISSANDTWLESNDLQSEANDRVLDAELQTVTVKPSSNSFSLEISSSGLTAPRRRRSYTTYPCIGLNSVNSLREQRILEKLQEEKVAGSHLQLESMVEKCRSGLCLSDLPVHEYRSLMDTRATGRLSYLIDILRRLKLVRLIGGDIPVGPHTILRHSLEFKPYIEEPVGMVLPYTGVNSFDLRPHVRHDFVLASKISVDEYWNTLEYCYAASDPKAALHAFPGSTVHEVFVSRSWASVRVMTAHQRAELFKLVANEDIDKKITYKKCEKIAEKLNLTLEQVLRKTKIGYW